ncbi:hypothetical protein OG558_22585 [Kribbella sp. NBC_01510]|uniref:hypothetical protein n=1 Tax=Kribbella sp. NBC_01510 TaxID=2903581 RepID=UPI00386A1A13
MPVHPGAARRQQDRSSRPVVDGAFDGPANGWGKRNQGDLVALAVHAQIPVAVLFAEIFDVAAGGLEDPQPEQTQHRYQGEVEPTG